MFGMYDDAVHWADRDALRLTVMPHALRATMRIDLAEILPRRNRLVGAFWFARITVDARRCDHECHGHFSAL